MAQEQKFLNNSFFKESKYGFKISIDPEALKSLKLVNGKYQIEAKKSRTGDKWYMVEDTWAPDPNYKKQPSYGMGYANQNKEEIDDLPDFLK